MDNGGCTILFRGVGCAHQSILQSKNVTVLLFNGLNDSSAFVEDLLEFVNLDVF